MTRRPGEVLRQFRWRLFGTLGTSTTCGRGRRRSRRAGAVHPRAGIGGTAPDAVAEQIASLRALL